MMQYGKFGTDQAEKDFRAWATYEWAKHAKGEGVVSEFYGAGITKLLADQSKIWRIDPPTYNFTGRTALRPSKEKNMKQLYWVAVLYRKGKKTELIVEPEIMLAVSEEKAKAGIINIIPSSYKERFDRLEVVVRPF
ncbi:hypothetical protein LCGC14_2206150 [marine sediment metagenome]|uniref:Uncharacterized protein n=1 Tax=marine sediment metagenome TaxID=412755 RepID=A0A0F9DF53_9ZZZZ